MTAGCFAKDLWQNKKGALNPYIGSKTPMSLFSQATLPDNFKRPVRAL
jgi:hypothetical protein